jgi:hypothetical protein
MLKLASFVVLSALCLQAEGQFPNTGVPASVVSPTADGRQHGVPASVVSPNPQIQALRRPNHGVVASRRPMRPFGNPRRRTLLVLVPLFYPAYGQTYDAESAVSDVADPGAVEGDSGGASPDDTSSVSANEDALHRAYLEGARDALARQTDRYGKHYLDSRESAPSRPLAQNRRPDPAPVVKAEVEDTPTTVFIFKDGRQIETRNFAIMGQTLYDFTSAGLQKVQLSDLDTAATQKANDDRGTNVKLP